MAYLIVYSDGSHYDAAYWLKGKAEAKVRKLQRQLRSYPVAPSMRIEEHAADYIRSLGLRIYG